MKFWINLIVALLVVSPVAAQNTGPVVPWPLLTTLRPVDCSTLAGSWISYANGYAWFVEVRPTSQADAYSVRVQSHSLPTKSAFGWLHKDGQMYLGSLAIDKVGVLGALLYQDTEALKLRISTNPRHFLDLPLYRTE